jgi:hypothetical protein
MFILITLTLVAFSTYLTLRGSDAELHPSSSDDPER